MSKFTHVRITLATEQLGVAIALYIQKGSMVTALTLAGAAEEILGSELKHKGINNALDEKYEIVKLIPCLHEPAHLQWKGFCKAKNHARNAAKHVNANDDRTLIADLEDEAMRMIVRAMENCRQLGLPLSSGMQEFECWFYVNVIGITGMGY